ncbi:MAG: MltA domain-containing protein [Planctomycetota bacterium]|nr:MltA domain-containing protein [Planctomycetota bacterium]MDW8372570.1 MltA domain-containing protein [Planctomycetota bacterium]
MLRASLLCVLALLAGGCARRAPPPAPPPPPNYSAALPEGRAALVEVDPATLPPLRLSPEERSALQAGIRHSLAFLERASSAERFPRELPIDRALVQRTLRDLAALLATASDEELERALRTRYRAFASVGWDGSGTVLFSGYYTPILAASWTRDERYRYPVYKRPPQLVGGGVHEQAQWRRADGTLVPCPPYQELEASGALAGLELLWFADPWEAYTVRVQGSAKVRLRDGQVIDIGYAGTTGHPYVAIGPLLVAEGKLPAEQLTAEGLRQYFRAHPDELPRYAARNPRGVFFTVTSGGPYGSLGQPVTAEVTIATDKQLFPPAAPVLVQTTAIAADGRAVPYVGLRLDQDTGGAMRAPGRADLYYGVGDAAGLRAGRQWHEGRMWYLVLRP